MEFKAIYELLYTHLKCFNIRDIITIYPKQVLDYILFYYIL